MGKIGGFKEYSRNDESNLVVEERVSNYNEFTIPLNKEAIKPILACLKQSTQTRPLSDASE